MPLLFTDIFTDEIEKILNDRRKRLHLQMNRRKKLLSISKSIKTRQTLKFHPFFKEIWSEN